MYENMKERIDLEDGSWKELKWKINVDLDGWTQINVLIRNNPLNLFEFFENEKIKLEECKWFDLKKRMGKKFLTWVKENIDIRDTSYLIKIFDNIDLKDKYAFRSVSVGYCFNTVSYG